MQRGETKGVFQFESAGIRDLLIKMKPDRFTDIIATNALYRPGPLNGGMVDEYVDVKNGRKQATYLHPVLKEVLEETYGVMVYQEQVMRILNRLGGIELSQAYATIKAISKKKADVIAQSRDQFLKGAMAQGLERDKAAKIFDLIEYFGGYGFNKSHSTAYALVAYQTAYLKAHYPTEYMAAVLSSEMDGAERDKFLLEHIEDCRRMEIEVLPPNINEGQLDFRVAGEGQIHFGLGAIKGVGFKAVEAIVKAREEKGPFTEPRRLLRAGSDQGRRRRLRGDLDPRRRLRLPGSEAANLLQPSSARLPRPSRPARPSRRTAAAVSSGSSTSRAPTICPPPRQRRQRPCSRLDEPPRTSRSSPTPRSWPGRRRRSAFTCPATRWPAMPACCKRWPPTGSPTWPRVPEKTEVVLGGMITNITGRNVQKSRSGLTRMAKLTFEDLSGSTPAMLWPEEFAKMADPVKNDQIVFVKGTLDRRRDPAELIISRIIPLEQGPAELTRGVVVRLHKGVHQTEHLERLLRAVRVRPGNLDLYLEIVGLEQVRRADLPGRRVAARSLRRPTDC